MKRLRTELACFRSLISQRYVDIATSNNVDLDVFMLFQLLIVTQCTVIVLQSYCMF